MNQLHLHLVVLLPMLLSLQEYCYAEKPSDWVDARHLSLWELEVLPHHLPKTPSIPSNFQKNNPYTVLPLNPLFTSGYRLPLEKSQHILLMENTDFPGGLSSYSFFHRDEFGDVVQLVTHDFGNATSLVYAPWVFSPHDSTDFIVAQNSSSPSSALSVRPAFSTLVPSGVSEVEVPIVRLFDQDRVYVRFSPADPGERLHMTWVIFPSSGNPPASTTVSLPVADYFTSTSVTVVAEVWGLTQDPATNPDHHGILSLDGSPLPLAQWEGLTRHTVSATTNFASTGVRGSIPLSHAISTTSPTAASASDSQMIERVELRFFGYPRLNPQGYGELEFYDLPSPKIVTMGGFPSGTNTDQVVILDITEPYRPVLLQNPGLLPDASGGVAVGFEAPAGSSRFAVQYLPTIASPDPVALVPLPEPSDILVGNPLRRIYVTYPEFNSSLQPLINHRGGGTYLLNPQAAFDAFSLGRNDPEAMRAALSWVVRESPVRSPLPNVLLVGHSSFDPNNVLGHFSENQLPVYYEKSFPTTIGELEVAIDYPFSVLLPGDELPDVRLGRVPAKTSVDLDKFVARQLAYEALGTSLVNSTRGGYLIADVAVEFQDDQPRWQALWTATGRTAT
ncbi:MAG: C25 family cysteine peptidase, partial [Candidatus Sumerlaeia bacterium]|nr:C25 family cysteine peptidase [Candidatus Sumerlaeia bacterium]